VKAACKNVETPSGIQVPDEPLELSVIDHWREQHAPERRHEGETSPQEVVLG
jgi:hypothetical protein